MPIAIFLKAFNVPVPLTKTRSINKRWKTLKSNKKNRLRKKKGKTRKRKEINTKDGKMHLYKKCHCDKKKS